MTSRMLDWLALRVEAHGDRVALEGDAEARSYRELHASVERWASDLRDRGVRCLGLLADNGVPWVTVDLAAAAAGVPLVPLPGFFTDAQLRDVIDRAGVDLLVTDDPERLDRLAAGCTREDPLGGLEARRRTATPRLPAGAAKVTFTSGSTGHPKGVVLDLEVQLGVAESTAAETGAAPSDRHLCLHSLAILLENVAGVLRVLAAGGTAVLPSESARGVVGSCGLNPAAALTALRRARATSAILVPSFLVELLGRIDRRPEERPSTLRFVGVGGARVPPALLERAARIGLPAVEGYGLSEAGSVCTLNRLGDRVVGSVGTPLPGVEVRIAPDGEVLIRGRRCLGYLDRPAPPVDRDGFWPTGDLGRLDERGRLRLEGRKRDVLCTGAGRNVAPAWVEEVLTDEPEISSASVSEGGGELIAVVRSSRDAAAVGEAIRRANRALPDYARVRHWRLLDEPRLAGHDPKEVPSCSTTA